MAEDRRHPQELEDNLPQNKKFNQNQNQNKYPKSVSQSSFPFPCSPAPKKLPTVASLYYHCIWCGELKPILQNMKWKNPTYMRHQISQSMGIIAPIPFFFSSMHAIKVFLIYIFMGGCDCLMRGLQMIILSEGKWEASKKITD